MSPSAPFFNIVLSKSSYSPYSYVPLLVQLHQKWRRLYRGFCVGSGFRTVFEMAHLRHIPKQFNHLKGLLDVFKDKLVCKFIVLLKFISESYVLGQTFVCVL